MSYITMDDYQAYGGEEIAVEDFPTFAERASEAVDAKTGWMVKQRGLDDFGEFDQQQIKLACCAQAEYLYYNGIETALGGMFASGGGYTIGRTSITGGGSSAASTGGGTAGGLCAKALEALWITGLLYRGVRMC